jgi:hypothetical protein
MYGEAKKEMPRTISAGKRRGKKPQTILNLN